MAPGSTRRKVCQHFFNRPLNRFMFPDPYRSPSLCAQAHVRIGIALLVGVNLVVPPIGIVLGRNVVLGAAMPETAINENCHLGGPEGDVRAASRHTGQRTVDPIAKTERKQGATQGNFRRGVADLLVRHIASYHSRGGLWAAMRIRAFRSRLCPAHTGQNMRPGQLPVAGRAREARRGTRSSRSSAAAVMTRCRSSSSSRNSRSLGPVNLVMFLTS